MPVSKRSAAQALVLRGSLVSLTRKCGKPTCRCAEGEPHSTPALSYSVGGATKMLTLRPSDLREVRAALARHQRVIAALERQTLRSVDLLRKRIARERAGARGTRR
jgi:hypothetical protein